VLAGSAAAIMPTLFCEIDPRGSDSLVGFGYEPDVVEIKKPADLEEVFWGIYKRSADYKRYKCLVIDGVGELAKRGMDIAMKSGPLKETDFLSSERFPQRREWGVMTENMRKVIRYMSDLPVHLIWTTTDRTFTDAKGNVLRIGPSLNPGLVDDLCNACTMIGYMHLGKGASRYLILGPCEINDTPVTTGNRLGLGPEFESIKNPTFEKIMQAVNGIGRESVDGEDPVHHHRRGS
jgi:hypothetical protein